MLKRLRCVVASVAGQAELVIYLFYVGSRLKQMQYSEFVAYGWPIGSGIVENTNKMVVEDHLRGAGMQWAEPSVKPLLALCNAVCDDRWMQTWAIIEQGQRRQVATKRRTQQAKCCASRAAIEVLTVAPEVVTLL